ncbi:MAG TPA: hypothetical protein PK054_00085 [Anaerohalosphaeraceae bacterium]|nr:hypothetical protein [Anaerohalosphaeraceae bacterium]HOL89377.1 hypothetical protein [Anaerohalosphaeraceae bacterium]HPP54960.1 hypothetical protein [Anaerohalosphaeraceae bacterium]
MKTIIRLLWIGVLTAAVCPAAEKKPQPSGAASEASVQELQDQPLEPWRLELLDVAFETAAKMPIKPHLKDRSRTQAMVVETALKLNQPERALRYLQQIENWRRGACLADLAVYAARQQNAPLAEQYLRQAREIAEKGLSGAHQEPVQEWRRDLIQSKIAQGYAQLGQLETALKAQEGLEPSQRGKMLLGDSQLQQKDLFDKEVQRLDSELKQNNADVRNNVLFSYAQMYEMVYDRQEQRSQLEEKIRNSWSPLPVFLRIQLLTRLTEAALDHNDSAKALELLDEVRRLMEKYQWPDETQFTLGAPLAALRYRAGQPQEAEKEVQTLLKSYEAKRQSIFNIYRADALRPLAEAYAQMDDKDTALALYKRAVEEGVENLNSRPRAEDLAATCCSMVLFAVEPDAELRERIRQIHKGLGQPW